MPWFPSWSTGWRACATSRRPRPPEGANFGLSVDSDEPLSISSDELEAVQSQGARRLVFTENVVVTQADVRITTRRLEAFYPSGSSKPDRLVATGDVVMAQGEREAHCDEAIYARGDQRLVCRGNAELQDGPDRVAGEEIVFDLATEAVTVTGNAAVVFHPGRIGQRRARGAQLMATLRGVELTKRYGEREAVRKLSLQVDPAEVVGLLGPNGAGKTTTFNMIVGGIRPTQGQVFLGERRSPTSPCTDGHASASRISRRNPRVSKAFGRRQRERDPRDGGAQSRERRARLGELLQSSV